MILLFWSFFLGKEHKYRKLEVVNKGKSIPCETLHVCKTLKLLVIFSINTTYKQPYMLFFRPLF